MAEISRACYAALYGPTVGDRVRLADTDLFIEITEDRSRWRPGLAGDEAVFGGGKVLRESMGQSIGRRVPTGTPDTGHHRRGRSSTTGESIKADVGIRDGRITAHRQGGQPGHRCPACTPSWWWGPSTEIIAGNGIAS